MRAAGNVGKRLEDASARGEWRMRWRDEVVRIGVGRATGSQRSWDGGRAAYRVIAVPRYLGGSVDLGICVGIWTDLEGLTDS